MWHVFVMFISNHFQLNINCHRCLFAVHRAVDWAALSDRIWSILLKRNICSWPTLKNNTWSSPRVAFPRRGITSSAIVGSLVKSNRWPCHAWPSMRALEDVRPDLRTLSREGTTQLYHSLTFSSVIKQYFTTMGLHWERGVTPMLYLRWRLPDLSPWT